MPKTLPRHSNSLSALSMLMESCVGGPCASKSHYDFRSLCQKTMVFNRFHFPCCKLFSKIHGIVDKNLPFQTSSSLFRWVHFHPNMSQLRPPSEHLHACLGSQPTFGRKMTNAILKPLNLFACLLRQKKDGTKWETDCKPLCSFSRFSC